MIKTFKVSLADDVKTDLSIKATGATKIRYKMLFGRNLDAEMGELLKTMSNAKLDALKELGDGAVDKGTLDAENTKVVADLLVNGTMDIITRVGYVMARTAEYKADELSEDDYFKWLDKFSSFEIESHAGEIISCYYSMKDTDIAEKKNRDQLTVN